MSEARKINEGVVSSLADTDLIFAVDPGGTTPKPISLANLAKAVRSRINLSKTSQVSLSGGEWVRVARFTASVSAGILSVVQTWNAGRPVALVCAFNAAHANADGVFAERLTSEGFFAPGQDVNTGLSFTAVRFVKENNVAYMEVRFKTGSSTSNIVCSLGAASNVELLEAEVSNAAASDVLKTIDFSGGGNSQIFNSLQKSCLRRAERRAA